MENVDFIEEKTQILRKPVSIGTGDGQVTYSQLELREPTSEEYEQASRAATNVGVSIALISIVTKIPRSAIGKLCMRDFKDACSFLTQEEDRKIGETPSPS